MLKEKIILKTYSCSEGINPGIPLVNVHKLSKIEYQGSQAFK
jgi:hypothetical protein